MAEETKSKNPLNDDFAKFARTAMERFHCPGVSVGVVLKDDTFTAGYGYAELPDKPVTPETLFFAASTTKSFTNAALALLMEEKKHITWQTTIASLMRANFVLQDEYITNHATLEDAASHRMSLPGHDECYGREDKTIQDIVRRLRHLPMSDEPFRTKYQYCNVGYITLCAVIEKVTGTSTEEYFKQKIWEPLGMDSTFFAERPDRTEAKTNLPLARGYLWDDENSKYVEEEYTDMTLASGAGANVSNVLDYTKYLQMMLKKTGPLSEKSHDQLRKPRVFVEKPPSKASIFQGPASYALGWHVVVYRGVEFIYHAGGLLGFAALMGYIPSLSFGAIFFANALNGGYFAIEAMFYSLVDDVLGIPAVERFDLMDISTKTLAGMKDMPNDTRNSLYGSIPAEKRVDISLESLQGTYSSPAYQSYTFKISKRSTEIPASDEYGSGEAKVLRADPTGKLNDHAIELEHVNGVHFIAWFLRPIDGRKSESLVKGVKAEFKIGAKGDVSELGIAFEPAIGERKIWFKKDE